MSITISFGPNGYVVDSLPELEDPDEVITIDITEPPREIHGYFHRVGVLLEQGQRLVRNMIDLIGFQQWRRNLGHRDDMYNLYDFYRSIEMDLITLACAFDEKQCTESKCSICLTDFEEKEVIIKLRCTHLYHVACIKQWLFYSQLNCPLCRRDVTTTTA